MIYDGNSTPYVPVMAKFYRRNDYTSWPNSKKSGLKYISVDTSKMEFSTSDNNIWNFVKENYYNYTADGNRKCSSNKSGNTSFSDTKHGHYYASGRLTCKQEPSDLLTDLRCF